MLDMNLLPSSWFPKIQAEIIVPQYILDMSFRF